MDFVQENFNYAEILENIIDGVYFINQDGNITYWNKGAEFITGFSSHEVLGRKCSDNILMHIDENGCSMCGSICPLFDSLNDGLPREKEVYVHHKKGQRVPIWVRSAPLRNKEGKIIGAIELFSDLSRRDDYILKLRELEKLALIDELTKISNRRYIEMEIRARLEEKKRYNISFGLLFVDIDFFKKINDTYGHSIGDDVLRMTATTLSSSCRPFDIFGRWGGEEFIGIVRNVDESNLFQVADRFRKLIEQSYISVNSHKISITISIGASICRDDDTITSLIDRCDELLYKSKSNGRNQVITG